MCEIINTHTQVEKDWASVIVFHVIVCDGVGSNAYIDDTS